VLEIVNEPPVTERFSVLFKLLTVVVPLE